MTERSRADIDAPLHRWTCSDGCSLPELLLNQAAFCPKNSVDGQSALSKKLVVK